MFDCTGLSCFNLSYRHDYTENLIKLTLRLGKVSFMYLEILELMRAFMLMFLISLYLKTFRRMASLILNAKLEMDYLQHQVLNAQFVGSYVSYKTPKHEYFVR